MLSGWRIKCAQPPRPFQISECSRKRGNNCDESGNDKIAVGPRRVSIIESHSVWRCGGIKEITKKRKNGRFRQVSHITSQACYLTFRGSLQVEGCQDNFTSFDCPSFVVLFSGFLTYLTNKPIGSLSCYHSSLYTSCWIRQATLIRRLPACDWSLSVSLGMVLLIQMTEHVFNFKRWPPNNKVRSPALNHGRTTVRNGKLAETHGALSA